jgi:hypothetical protein
MQQLLNHRVAEQMAAQRQRVHCPSVSPASDTEAKAVVQACLRQIRVVRCESSFQFLASLTSLRYSKELLKADGGASLVVVDNLAAFHHQNKVGLAT